MSTKESNIGAEAPLDTSHLNIPALPTVDLCMMQTRTNDTPEWEKGKKARVEPKISTRNCFRTRDEADSFFDFDFLLASS